MCTQLPTAIIFDWLLVESIAFATAPRVEIPVTLIPIGK